MIFILIIERKKDIEIDESFIYYTYKCIWFKFVIALKF